MKKLFLIGVAAFALATVNLKADFLGFSLDTNALAATNWTVALSPAYAPGLKDSAGNKEEWGVTAAALYPLNNGNFQVLTGFRLDYLAGEFWMPSVNVTLEAPMTFHGIAFTPFALTGLGVPLGGSHANDQPTGIAGGGLSVQIAKWSRGHVSLVGEAEKWTAPIDKTVYHFGAAVTLHF